MSTALMPPPQPGFACFVTGTDTEIGKTRISAALLHALAEQGQGAVGMKPVAAGAEWHDGAWRNEDAELLAQAGNLAFDRTLTTPYLWQAAIAPHIAAEREGAGMSLQVILDAYGQLASQADAVVVEGVGGFCVPLSDTLDTAGMAGALGLPVVLVVGLRLGCISHALLTVQAIAAQGLSLAGWVANTVDTAMPCMQENIDTLRRRIVAPLLGHVPRLPQPDPAAVAACLDFSLLPGWPEGHAR